MPECWDGPHVGKRPVEGLGTLTLMPMPRGPRASGNHWPAYAYDWADLLAQQEADEEQKARDQREQNYTRLRPSSVEIAHMEQSIRWPRQYLREFPQLVRTVQQVAVARMRARTTRLIDLANGGATLDEIMSDDVIGVATVQGVEKQVHEIMPTDR